MRIPRLTTFSCAVIGLGLLGAVAPATASIVETNAPTYAATTYPPPTYPPADYAPADGAAATTPIFYDPSCRTVRQRSGAAVIECDDGYIE
jgi:hypothetical protein